MILRPPSSKNESEYVATQFAFLGELLGSRCGVEDLGTCKVAVGEHFHDADGHGSASTRASYAA